MYNQSTLGFGWSPDEQRGTILSLKYLVYNNMSNSIELFFVILLSYAFNIWAYVLYEADTDRSFLLKYDNILL